MVSFCLNNIYLQEKQVNINENVSKREISNIELAPKYSKNVGYGEGILIHLPNIEGNMTGYRFFKNDFMSQEMQMNYPEITTYTGFSVTNKSEFINIVKHGDKINGILMGHSSHHLLEIDNGKYFLKDTQDDQFAQNTKGECRTNHTNFRPFLPTGQRNTALSVELRKFRLAVVITDQFENANNGGSNAIAAATVIVSNLNAIYKKELSIEFQVTIRPETNVYNISPAILASRAANAIIRYFNIGEYDLGHVFHHSSSLGGAGEANLGVVCDNSGSPTGKAGGWTQGNPTLGEGFLLVLAHEIAHMFGATHTFNGTFNSCGNLGQLAPLTSFEPGSGTTLMSYSGTCSGHNILLPNNSDAPRSSYFHTGSIEQIINFIESDKNICENKEIIENSPPLVTPNPSGFQLPIKLPRSTPFELKGQASDPDGDILTYCWEQMDIGPPHGAVNVACGSTNGPIFRSYDPIPNPSRFFPDLQYILNDNNSPASRIGECLPSVTREKLNFRLTVRDNNPQGGGIAFDDIPIMIDGNIGPMAIEVPNTLVNWTGGSKRTVTWNVNKTNEICDAVNILLSLDGGISFPFQLADNLPNNGSFEITLPESIPSTSTARVKVESNCSEFIKFFDISNTNFNLNTQCAILTKFGICNDKPVVSTEGSEPLTLNLPKEINKINNSISLSTTNPRVLVPINLQPVPGQGTCTDKNNLNYFSKKLEFIIDKSGTYIFEVPSQRIISIFSNTYNPNAPCDNYIGSNGYDINGVPGGTSGGNTRLTLNLNECQNYTIVLFTQSIINNTEIKVIGPDGSLFLTPELISPDFDLTYMAVDSLSQVIKAFNPTGNFITLSSGSYKVYCLYYFAGAALLPQKIELDALINKKLTEVLSYNSCFSISQNFKPIKVLPLCNRTIEIPDIAGISQICQGQSTILTASGGSSYFWNTQAQTHSITVSPLTTTTYFLTITDAEGCSASKNITVTVHPNPSPVIAGTDLICYNGSAELDAGEGYTNYNWSEGAGSERQAVFNELKVDKTITVTVTDANQCQGVASIDLNVRQPITPIIYGHENLCNGDEIVLSTSADYSEYEWSDEGGNQAEAVYINVIPGKQYLVTVTDNFGCTGSNTASIGDFSGLSVFISKENTSCGFDNGSLVAYVSTQGNYNYLWNNQQSDDQISGLAAGTYMVTVTDEKGCSGTATTTIATSDEIALDQQVMHTSCGLPNGAASIIAEGGSGYRYLWNDDNTSGLRENMAPGLYTVTVTATGDCTASVDVIIEDSQGLSLSAEIIHTTCGEPNGSISVFASGGEGYIYEWSTGDFGPLLFGLSDGNYSVTVTDSRACIAVLEKNILPSLLLQVEINGPDAVCEGGTATIMVPTGLLYEWNTGETNASIQVSSGEYIVTVTDLTGCTTVATKSIQTLLLPAPDILGADGACRNKTVTLSVPDGDLFAWSTGQSTQSIEVGTGIYSVTATDLNGCSSVGSKTVSVLTDPVVNINGANEVCDGNLLLITATGGVDYRWSSGENTANILVSKGSYTVTVTNNNGCTATNEKTINNYINPSVSIAGANSVCQGNTTTITASGGLSYKWSNGPNTAINSVTTGSYTVTATDINGCTATSQKTINSLMGPTINIAGITNICFGDVTTLTVSGGISYVWNTGINTPSINVGIGTYTVTVSDINGCTSSKNVDIQLSTLPSIQTKDISFSSISKNQITLKWVNGNGKCRIVVAKANSPVLGTPLNGITYNGDTSFGIGAQLSPGEFIVYNGTGTSLTVTNLIENNTYHFRIFEYGCSKNYLTTIANGNPANQIAKCLSPTNQSTTISFSLVSTNQFTANWSNGNGSRRVVKINTVNNFSPPANGTDPLANSKYVGYGEQVVYNGAGSSVTITGLMPNMTYWVRIYEANCSGSSSFYNTSPGTNNPISQRTRTVLPSVQSFSASNVTFNGNNIVDINPIFFTNQPYATHPPIDIFLQGNNKTRFTLNASYAVGFSFQLVDQLTIVTDGTMAISPQTYGQLGPVISTSVNSMYMDYTHPEYVNVNPYLSLKIRLLFEGGLVGMDIPVHIHAPQGALPVELIDFRAQYNKHADINELSWITKSEVNNDYFDIERSFESFSFENIGRVAGSGNSSATINYVFNDKNISQDGNYTYRLKQVDLNGKTTFSKPASVKVFRSQSIKTGLFPNPASDLINCYVEAHEGSIVNIDIFNGLGQKVSRNVIPEIIGSMGFMRQIDSKDFGKGIFTVVFNIDGIRYNHKLIIID